ncbi:N-acetylmuramoyl-L-alanine amidase [Tepidibacillus fermentans]|uniref:N-acetylmuramoyl-L-alanine amidase n=1 Tax=Tepidibacillus fermentans TaxID=1281767 RepID=A0A4R3KBL6_9BACI|nr:N-acetylmuramoyl-L-alanine amidase [Tepidibacillus fermentans]TCS80390.1 N-acetylmuramoyl-L-alanine amidase [Tepidibacillus fermentans]
MSKIFIDAGHGGNDPGAVGNGIQEKNITLKLATMLRDFLIKNYVCEVKMTREADVFVELSQRDNIANNWKADYFISLHVNAGGGQGFESHIYNGTVSAKTIAMQNVIHGEVMSYLKQFNITDRGKKRSNFSVVRETKMPAILTENLFIDNSREAGLLKDDKFLRGLAEAHGRGLAKGLGLQVKPVESKSKTSNKLLYKVQVGVFAEKANADRLAAELKAKGYNVFVVQE